MSASADQQATHDPTEKITHIRQLLVEFDRFAQERRKPTGKASKPRRERLFLPGAVFAALDGPRGPVSRPQRLLRMGSHQ